MCIMYLAELGMLTRGTCLYLGQAGNVHISLKSYLGQKTALESLQLAEQSNFLMWERRENATGKGNTEAQGSEDGRWGGGVKLYLGQKIR